MDIAAFVCKWHLASGGERKAKDYFLLDLCAALGVPPKQDRARRGAKHIRQGPPEQVEESRGREAVRVVDSRVFHQREVALLALRRCLSEPRNQMKSQLFG